MSSRQMSRFCLYLLDRQIDQMQQVKDKTEFSISEITRRFFDHCLQTNVLQELVPTMSGHSFISK